MRKNYKFAVIYESKGDIVECHAEAKTRKLAEEWCCFEGFKPLYIVKTGLEHRVFKRWRLDKRAFNRTIDTLNIKWPIRVVNTRNIAGLGKHSLRIYKFNFSPKHVIYVSKYVDAEKANRIIWHELSHALQAEQAAVHKDKASDMFLAAKHSLRRSRHVAYADRENEKQAKEFEKNANETTLTKESNKWFVRL